MGKPEREVYLVILEDRHADVEVEVFEHLDDARASFEDVLSQYARELARVPADDQMTPAQIAEADWIAHRTLTPEGDAVRLECVEVQ